MSISSVCRALVSLETFASTLWTLSPSDAIFEIFSSAYSRNRSETVKLRPLIMNSMVPSK